MKLRGVSLMEAVVAIFILTGGCLASFTLLIQAFRYQLASESTNSALLLAQRSLGAIRDWAGTPENFDGDWSTYADQSFQLGEFPGLEARVSVGPLHDTHSHVRATARVVEVTVHRDQRRLLSITGLLTSPPRRPRPTDPIEVEATSPQATLGQNQLLQYRAALYDVNDRLIPGVSFEFSQQGLLPTPGSGTLVADLPAALNLTHASPGRLRVVARARYRGMVFQGLSDPLELLP